MVENTYEKLIKAAIEIMNEEGYAGTSIGNLASKVGISKSTVIHYFKSKEGVLLAVLENFLPAYMHEFKPILESKSIKGVEKLHRFILFHMKIVSERRELLSINLRDTKYLSGTNKVIYQDQQRVYEEQVIKIIKQIQKENKSIFKGLDPTVTAKAIIGMCNYACIWYKENGPYTMNEIAEQFFAIITGGSYTPTRV